MTSPGGVGTVQVALENLSWNTTMVEYVGWIYLVHIIYCIDDFSACIREGFPGFQEDDPGIVRKRFSTCL